MTVQIDEALLAFGKWAIGRIIRGQRVTGVGIDIDTLPQPEHDLRYIIYVYFLEGEPREDSDPEERLLDVIFDERPKNGRIVTNDPNELRERLSGIRPCLDTEWILDDEEYIQPRAD